MTPVYLEVAGLKIAEPATLVTDYVMAGLAAWFCLGLAKTGRRWWSAAFGALAVSSLLGGTWHGFQLELPTGLGAVLWKLTLASASVCSCFLLVAAAQLLTASLRTLVVVVAVAKLLPFLVLIWIAPAFLKVLADFAISFALAGLIGFVARERAPGFGFRLAAGIGLFILGGTIQALKLAPHVWFNHNDLFHLVQIAANTALFLAARRTP